MTCVSRPGAPARRRCWMPLPGGGSIPFEAGAVWAECAGQRPEPGGGGDDEGGDGVPAKSLGQTCNMRLISG